MSDRYNYSNVQLFLPFHRDVIEDMSPYGRVPRETPSGGFSTIIKKWASYENSYGFTTFNDRLPYDVTDPIDPKERDFCLAFWYHPTALAYDASICSMGLNLAALSATNIVFRLVTAPASMFVRFSVASSVTVEAFKVDIGTITLDEWQHIAVTRQGTTYRSFLNGALIDTVTDSTVMNVGVGMVLALGKALTQANTQGRYNDFFWIVGEAVYTAAFTPPERGMGEITNTGVGAEVVKNAAGNPAARIILAVPRRAATRTFPGESNASGVFDFWAPAGIDHSVIALADEATLYNDIIHRVIPE